jgi:hypothetical protein
MMAEALVMKDGLELVSRLGCNSGKAESDLLTMVRTMTSP